MGFGKYEICEYCRYCECENVALNKNGQFACDREKIWVYADALPIKSNCFWRVASYNLSDRDPAIKFSKKYRGFYITTAIFERLHIDNQDELAKLYLFRHVYLENTKEGKTFLHDYDIFAPRIAKLITLSDVVNAKTYYEFYLKGVLKYICEDDLISASKLYIAMYERLKEQFIYEHLKTLKNKEQYKTMHL